MTTIHGPAVLREATSAQLEHAIALNHKELFCLEATLAGQKVNEHDGITWTGGGKNNNAMIIFPALSNENAGPILDEIMAGYLQHPPNGTLCWSLDPPETPDLDIRLLARGFQTGWTPSWMVLDLKNIQVNHPVPDELRIIADNTASIQHLKDIPYSQDSQRTLLSSTFKQSSRVKLQRFIATLRGEIVAHTNVVLTTGEYGVAGIYNVGVLPQLRKQGIGKAVVIAACLYAKEQGYQYATLNGTGRRMYEQIGFRWLSNGLTWWLKVDRFIAHPPSKQEVILAEAIGRGDMDALEQLSSHFNNDELSKPMTNGMTLMQLAVHCRQTSSVNWLMEKGVPIRVLEAWDLGWKDEAAQILSRHPEFVDQLYDEFEITILHEAARRNDMELAKLALSANASLTIKDKSFHGTPLDWATHFQRWEIIRLINKQV